MAKFFEPIDLSISGLFKDGDPIYKIPNYQRPYSWEDEQVYALWDDIYEAYNAFCEDPEKSQNYFLGSIIVVSSPTQPKVFDVVDGQQRITTLMILFNVIKGLFPDINKDVDAEQITDVVKLKLIESCIYNDNETRRLTFLTDDKHRNSFEDKILKNPDFTSISKPKKLTGVEEKFINTAYIFSEKLNEIKNEVGNFVNYLFNRVMIIKITCQDVNFAIKLFQVLNNRGLDLSQADLIKANLISSITQEEDKNSFMASWRDIESNLESLDISFTDLFGFQQNYLLASNPKKSLSEELSAVFKKFKDSNEVIIQTKKLQQHYKDLYNSEDKQFYGFWYLPWDIWKSIYLSIQYTGYPRSNMLAQKIMRFFYLYWIAGYTFSSIKQTSYNLIKWIKDKESIENIEKKLQDKLAEHDVIKKAKETLSGDDVYNRKWIKPLLCLLEYSLREQSSFIYWDRKLQVEHILPQSFLNASDWQHINESDGKKYLNCLGNLTLLSDVKNPEAKNYSFDKKIKIYQGHGLSGNQRKGWTQYLMTQEIVNQYKSKALKKWDIKAIKDRQNKMLEQISKLLNI